MTAARKPVTPMMLFRDGMEVLRARSGDRYVIRIAIGGGKLIDVYFADPLHLPELTRVDASPDEPNPPMWEHE